MALTLKKSLKDHVTCYKKIVFFLLVGLTLVILHQEIDLGSPGMLLCSQHHYLQYLA